MDFLNKVFFYNLGMQKSSLQGGKRPVLVLLDAGEHLLVTPLTTQKKNPLPTHAAVKTKGKPSTALLEQLFWIETPELREKDLFTLEDEEQALERVREALKVSIGLTPINQTHKLVLPYYRGQMFLTPNKEYFVVIQNNIGNKYSPCTIIGVFVSGKLKAIKTIDSDDLNDCAFVGRKRHVTEAAAEFLGL